jgi:hypothetical protein
MRSKNQRPRMNDVVARIVSIESGVVVALSPIPLPVHAESPVAEEIQTMGTSSWTTRLRRVGFLAAATMLTLPPIVMAQTGETQTATDSATATSQPPNPITTPSPSTAAGQPGWVERWMRTVDKARASQPHYVAPIVTTHVVLVEQYRYDMSRQEDASGTHTSNFGASRGLEIIPNDRIEIGISPPPYFAHQSAVADGFGDLSFQVKYRAFSAPEDRGDYFVGVFFAGSFPTGNPPNSVGHTIWTPTLAAAKGFGPVDIQTTLAAGLPASGVDVLGRTVVSNTAVDYRIIGKIWPMLELNSTFWSGGTNDGQKEVFLTPGLVVGSFPLAERLHLGLGVGVQIAVSDFFRDNHRWIASVRLPF